MHGAMRERSDVLECFCCLAAAVTLWGVLNLCGSYITDSAHVTDLKKAKGLSCVAGWSERACTRTHTCEQIHTYTELTQLFPAVTWTWEHPVARSFVNVRGGKQIYRCSRFSGRSSSFRTKRCETKTKQSTKAEKKEKIKHEMKWMK